jgi:hypothetical protein
MPVAFIQEFKFRSDDRTTTNYDAELPPNPLKKPRFRGYQWRSIGVPRFELGTSCPPDKRANQAAPHPEAAQDTWADGKPCQSPRRL